uniref:Uncharacterized protein n=1 Tax=uncultured Methanosarcinales archaeon TaxID=183757 RepID=A0A7H1KNQ4_9EURY|nr:hypothetical protein HCAOCCDF_00016 [uncultured Methanosarcinales archaeon]
MKQAKQEFPQQIVLNRLRFNSIEFENRCVKLQMGRDQDYAFQIGVANYGEPARIYLTASPEIQDSIRFLHNDFVVATNAVVDVVAHIRMRQRGSISVTVGYGSNTGSFDVDLVADAVHAIEVDPSLGIPGNPEKYRLATHIPMPAAMKAIGALMLVFTVLTLVTDIVPAVIGAVSASLLLAIVIMYFLLPHVR